MTPKQGILDKDGKLKGILYCQTCKDETLHETNDPKFMAWQCLSCLTKVVHYEDID